MDSYVGSYMNPISNAFLTQVIVYQDIQGGKPCDKRGIVVVSPRQSESVAFFKRRLEKPESNISFLTSIYLPGRKGVYMALDETVVQVTPHGMLIEIHSSLAHPLSFECLQCS